MRPEKNEDFILPVVADSTQRKFTLLVVSLSLFVFLGIYLLSAQFSPLIYLKVVDEPDCPASFLNYNRFCHRYDLSADTSWFSTVYGLNKTNSLIILGASFEVVPQLRNSTFNFQVNYTATFYPLTDKGNWMFNGPGDEVTNVTSLSRMSVTCQAGSDVCESNYLLMIPTIDTANIRLAVDLNIDDALGKLVTHANFFMYTSNPKYTVYLLVLRYALLLISLVSLGFYARFYFNLQLENRTFEHRFILFLGAALVLFNDPLYALTTFYGSVPLALLSTLHLSMFMAALLFFWMVMFPRITFEINRVQTRFAGSMPRLLAFFVFVLLTLLLSIQTVYVRFNPSIHFELQFPVLHHAVLLLVAYSVSILFFFLFFHSARVLNRWSQLRMRHRFFFVWTCVFLAVLLGLLLSGMFQSYDRDGPQILTLFFVCNYYVVSLQILWRLSHGQMSAVSQAVRDVKEEIREGIIKNVDQSATLNASSGDLPKDSEDALGSGDLVVVNGGLGGPAQETGEAGPAEGQTVYQGRTEDDERQVMTTAP